MASSLFFEEDEVSILTDGDGLRYGLVTESSEYFSSDDEDGDAAVYERLRKGTVRVSWHPDGQSQVITETELHLVDRALMPGDVVRRFIEGEDSQRGYVIMTRIMCHVQVTGKPIVICDIDSRDLLPISPFSTQPGDVYLDSWVGKVANILERVTVRFSDGARCEVTDEEAVAMLLEFTDVYDKQSKDSAFSPMVFYEGQVLKGDLGSFQDVKWLRTTRLHNKKSARKYQNRHVNITIEKVETYQLEVNWICQGFSNQESALSGLQPPPRIIKGETLQRVKRLDCFESCNYKVGERALHILKDSDTVITLDSKDRHTAMHQVNQAKGKCAETKPLTNIKILKEKKSTDNTQMSSIENNLSCDRLLKNDIEKEHMGEVSDASASVPEVNQTAEPVGVELTSSQSKTSIDKKPKTKPKKAAMQIHQLKSKKLKPAKLNTRGTSPNFSSVKPGQKLPVEVIHTSTTADIMWQDGSKELEIISTDLLPVHHLDEHEFFPGDYVVSSSEIQAPGVYGVIQSVDHKGRMCRVKWLQHGNASSIDSVLKVDEVSVYDTRDHPDLKFRTGHVVVRVNCEDSTEQASCINEKQLAVGQVYELTCEGPLTIQWHDGSRSQCYPLQLYLIGDEMSDLYSDSEDSFSDEIESSDSSYEWETEEETQLPLEDDFNESNSVGLTTSENLNGLEHAFLDNLKEVATRLEEVTVCLESKGLVTSCGKFSKYLLQFFRICVDFDSAIGTTLFAGKELAAAMAELKRMSKKNKTSHSNKQEVSIRSPVELQDQQKDLLPPIDESGNDSGLEKSPSSSELREIEANVSDLGIEGTGAAVTASSSMSSEIALKITDLNKRLSDADAEVLANCEVQNDSKTENGEQKADDFKDSTMVDIAAILERSRELLKRTQNMWQNSESEEKRLCLGALKLLCGAITSNPERLIDSIRSLCSKVNRKPLEGNFSCESTEDTACEAHNSADTADSLTNCAKAEVLQECSVEENGVMEDGENGSSPQKQQGLGLALSNTSSELVLEETDVASKTPLTPADIRAKVEFNPEGFTLLDSLPEFHHYKDQKHVPIDQKTFNSTIRNELKLLKSCLPNGIYVKGFESRMDLYSIMIKGPGRTPYEDGLFFFDVQLPNNYPSAPPLFFYISYCSDRLNPNLYEDGKVCVSLLGTWTGRGTEMWSTKSNLLQVLISIQGLILNPEPYYNEAGYERQKGTQIGHENSRMYNEMAIVKMVQSMSKIAVSPFQPFSAEIQSHLNFRAYRLINRLRYWISSLDNCPGDLDSSSAVLASSAVDDENSSNLISTCSAISSGEASKSTSSDHAITSNGSETQQKSNSEPSDLNNARLSKSDTSEGSVETFSRHKMCEETSLAPAFPLLPVSKGFKISLSKCLDNFEVVLQSVGFSKNVENS